MSFFVFANTANAADCDRACLSGMIDRYLNAMLTHNPSTLPLAAKVRVTDDSKETKLGQGMWETATKIRPNRQEYLDVKEGVAAAHVVLEENQSPVLFTLRLKIVDQKITEVETQAVHNRAEGQLFNPETVVSHDAMHYTPKPNERASREDAIRLAMFYPKGLTIGSFVNADAPFTLDAYRLENGGAMAGPGCTRAGCENIKTQTIIAHPALKAEVVAVDEEQGLVLLWMNFGNTGSYGSGNALVPYEAFKVWGGQIHAVQAFMKVMPEATKRNW
ncbi:MAG: hypothetical protein WDO18_08930 [Acidobacteriota bacterium]